jgi:hypothetical protein
VTAPDLGSAARVGSTALAAEALRVNARYVEEVVIGWNLCPWAARAWQDGQVVRRVFDAPVPAAATDDVVAFAGELAANQDAAIGLAIFPRAGVTIGAWESFAERVRRGVRGFMIAAFHPDYGDAADGAAVDPARLVALIRRTPDPTLQLVRATLLDGLARGGRDVSAEIARDNHNTVTTRGAPALDALVADIRHDRDTTYARLARGD